MTEARLLLLARDPVAAWRAHAAGDGDASPTRVFLASPTRVFLASPTRVFLASLRSAPLFGVGRGATTLERWARTPPTLVATPLARRRALVAAVAAGEGAGTAGAGTRADAVGAAAVAAAAIRELLRFADLDAPPADLDPRLARWWAVARRYRSALEDAGTVDPAEALRRATARWRAAAPARGPIALLGHLDLAPDEVDAVDALAGPGSVVVLPHDPPWTDANGPARAALRERGWIERVVDVAAPWPEVVALAPATPAVEARWAVAEAKRLLAAGCAPGDVVLTARDVAAYAAPLRAAARAAGLPLRIDRWRPLAATAAGAPVVAWLEAVAQRGAFEPTLAWLAHPRVARLTADDVDAVRRWRPNDPRAWARADGAAGAALGWPERATPAAWRELLEAGWSGFGLTPTADPGAGDPDPAADVADPFADPALAGPWRDALASLVDLADPAGRVARAVALGALRDALHAETVRDDGDVGHRGDGGDDGDGAGGGVGDGAGGGATPLTLRPVEALADARVPHVLLLGAVDGSLPTVTPDDPVLGFHDRAALAAAGVPLRTAGQFARLEALRFWGVRRAATERLWIGVPAQTGRDARLPSPYLARLGVAPRVVGEPPPASPAAFRAAALRAIDVPDAVDPVLPWARRAYAQALAREVEPRWGPDDGFPGLGVDPDALTWSATQLTNVGTCRFRWWVQRVWGVAAPEEGATDFTPLLEGRLYHGALEGALKGAIGLAGAKARAAAAAALDAAFERSERREGIADVVPHWSRRRDDHLVHLRALIAAPEFLPDEHEVVRIESRFEGVWHGWRVSGRVDRIDRTPDGVRLIDYKLGSGRPLGARDAELDPTLDLQLPLYVDVAAPQHAPGEAVAGAVYLSLRKMTEIAAHPPDPVELDDLFGRLRASLRAGFFPVEPHPSVCTRCDLALVCRKGPHLERKPATHRVPVAEGPS